MIVNKEKTELRHRLKKVAGQINGIDKMLDEGRYCVDILQQIVAARAALNKVALLIIESRQKLHRRGGQRGPGRPEHRRTDERIEAV